MKRFLVGKEYSVRSVCNHDCVWNFKVLKRTCKTVTLLSDRGETIRCRINEKISEYRNAESVYPLGNYSMAPILSA